MGEGVKPQTCKKCGRIQYVSWIVSDELWKVFCQKTGWNENDTICLECFAQLVGFIDLTEYGYIDDVIYPIKLWEK